MEIKIFISYFSDDNKKMQMLKSLIDSTDGLIPIVIADRRKSLIPLTQKVEEGIKESHIIVPILTGNSISSQWVNQEIGYASAFTNIKVMPIIENSIIDDLKGFIHKQVDLSYNFQRFPNNRRKESLNFKRCIVKLINDIREEYNIGLTTKTESESFGEKSPENFFENGYLKNTLKIYSPKDQLNISITPYIRHNSGILNFWAKVQSHHNEIKQEKKYLYIASSYSDNYLAAPNLARYPNMWAIFRETPTQENQFGKWRFVCNGENKERTAIDFNGHLSEGWHLFSVEWSVQMDFIKFYIDSNLTGKKPFENWPDNFKMSMSIGTWPDKNPKTHFYSPISSPIFIGEIDSRIIKEIYQYKPERIEKSTANK